jgi:hypothetical protein
MASTIRTPATNPPAKRVPMDPVRKTPLVAGIFYLITFISIPTLFLYAPVKNHQDWILSSGWHTAVLVGCFLEVIVALAGIGTAVTLYPVLKRQNEGGALGFVTARVLEGSMIFAGVASLLSLVTLRQHLGGAAGANTAALATAVTAGRNTAPSRPPQSPPGWPSRTPPRPSASPAASGPCPAGNGGLSPSTRSPAWTPARPPLPSSLDGYAATGRPKYCTTSATSATAKTPPRSAPAAGPRPWLPCATSASGS